MEKIMDAANEKLFYTFLKLLNDILEYVPGKTLSQFCEYLQIWSVA